MLKLPADELVIAPIATHHSFNVAYAVPSGPKKVRFIIAFVGLKINPAPVLDA